MLEFKLQIFPSGQLGAPEAQVQNVKLGIQDGFFEDLTWWSPFSPDLRIAGVPFEFEGRPHFQKWLATDTFKKIEQDVVANGGQRLLVGSNFVVARPLPGLDVDQARRDAGRRFEDQAAAAGNRVCSRATGGMRASIPMW